MIVFPAVDIRGGHAVRLLQGRPEDSTTYFDAPLDAALHWQALGAEALHVVDLDGTLSESGENRGHVQDILATLTIPVEVAGGLRDDDAVQRALDAGAARAVVGTRAAVEPEWAAALCERHPGRVVIAVDAREGEVMVRGWQEKSGVMAVDLAREIAPSGPAAFLYTDVARDGMFTGPHVAGIEALLAATDVPVIASGGVAELGDIRRLGECGADAVIVGKALYEKRVELPALLEAAARFGSRLSPSPA